MHPKLALALFPLLLPLSTPALRGQEDPSTPPVARSAPEPVVLSMEFRGGTLAEFVAAVRGRQPKANIVLAARAAGAKVPPMVLRDAGIEQTLEGAAMAAEAGFDVRVKEFRGDGEPVYSIVAYERPRQGVGPDPRESTQRVFSLNDLTGKQPHGVEPFSVETILGALKLATEEDDPPRIRFHEDSGLLLVRGTVAQAEAVDLTLRVMQRDLAERQQRAVALEQERRMREAEARNKQERDR